MDGRGPLSVYETLVEHLDTIQYIASTGKPFEANVSHHFAFRGSDDISYVLSAYLAAKAAKLRGIRYFVLQNMLNTPKGTWGIADLAKSRATLGLLSELVDENFRVILQPRAGLDYFSPNIEKVKIQLAAVSALMDDIDPHNHRSPSVIHVVSYSEGRHLADLDTVKESVQITQHALREYRKFRAAGLVEDMAENPDVFETTAQLIDDVRILLKSIEDKIPAPYTPEGLYRVFASGYLPVPYVWECRDEFRHAVRWNTKMLRGSVRVVDEKGNPVAPADRALVAEEIGARTARDTVRVFE